MIPGLSTTLIAYRDYSDIGCSFPIIEQLHKTKDLQEIRKFVKKVSCRGGGDIPEAVEMALEKALEAEINFGILLGDAEPHGVSDQIVEKDFRLVAKQLREKGIAIYTVATYEEDHLISSFKEIAQITGGQFFLLNQVDYLIDVLSVAVAKRVKKIDVLAALMKKEQKGKLTNHQIRLLTS